MKLELLNASVVVLAEHHNPTILHPSFLTAEDIVPATWKATETVCTPAFAMVKYDNGILFNVEANKFQVIQEQPENVSDSPLPMLAAKYVSKLPHVRYTAAGVNFNAFLENDKAEQDLMERFLRPNSADVDRLSPHTVGLRLIYRFDGTRLRYSCDAGRVKPAGAECERRGIVVNANYHVDLPVQEGERAVLSAIEGTTHQFGDYWSSFRNITAKLLTSEE